MNIQELLCEYQAIHEKLIEAKPDKIAAPVDAVPYCLKIAKKKQEHFLVLSLNGAHEVIQSRVVTVGLLNFCQVHPREIFRPAITDNAAAIIVCHNHPSGNLTPSRQDEDVTTRLIKAGELLGISVLDHIIVGSSGGYVSLKETTHLF